MSFMIRNYTAADKASVISLLRLNIPRYFAPEEEADFHRYLDEESDHYFVLETGGNMVGCGGFNLADGGATGKISWDFFHPHYYGKGFGSKLLEYRIHELKKITTVKQIIVRTSQLAYRFYEKNGFELQDVIKDYWAKGFDLYRMEYTKRA